MPGVPASLIRATVAPALSRSTIDADVPCSLKLVVGIELVLYLKMLEKYARRAGVLSQKPGRPPSRCVWP